MVEASKQFRRVNGHLHLPALRAALERQVGAVVFMGALVAADLLSALIGAAITGVCTAVACHTKDQK